MTALIDEANKDISEVWLSTSVLWFPLAEKRDIDRKSAMGVALRALGQ